MIFQEDGSWTVEFPEKATGKLYRLAVTHHEHENPRESSTGEFLDPYSLATVGRAGPTALQFIPRLPSTKTKLSPPRNGGPRHCGSPPGLIFWLRLQSN